MYRTEFINNVCDRLKDCGVRKPVSLPKHNFHISDDEGNEHDFTVRQTKKTVMYTAKDVDNIITACMDVIADALAKGDSVMFRGFGGIYLQYRKPRLIHNVTLGEWEQIGGRYIPKLMPGNTLKLSARLYALANGDNSPEAPDYDELEGDEQSRDFDEAPDDIEEDDDDGV